MRNDVIAGIAKVIITIMALILAAAHTIWPDLVIDMVTLSLIVIAILPWLSPVLRSLELPGGVKIEFRDMEKAIENIYKAGLLSTESEKGYEHSFQLVSEEDPALALAGLRIEIEKRLREIAKMSDIPGDKKGAGQLLKKLTKKRILTNEERSALGDLINLLNRAVHGGELNEKAAEKAIETGPRILGIVCASLLGNRFRSRRLLTKFLGF